MSDQFPPTRTVAAFVFLLLVAQDCRAANDSLIESITVSSPAVAPDNDTYWMQSRPAIIPTSDPIKPKAVITMQKTDRVGTHMYHALATTWSSDLGKTWSPPEEVPAVDRIKRPDGLLDTPCDFTPQWHAKTGKLLVTAASFMLDPKARHNLPRGPSSVVYAVYDPATQKWDDRQIVKLPDSDKFFFARAGCIQRVDLPNGDVLLPIYFYSKGAEEVNYVTVLRCGFDGKALTYKEHGNELSVDLKAKRTRTGLYEPSLTEFGGKYFITLRADKAAYVSTSTDGLHFTEPKPWTFDDGQSLGSYDTQQHWVTHSDGLYLAYTRKGADNDKIFRNRAPLFIARVDPERLVVERETEQILLPNLGDAFGNFGVCNITPDETWVVDCLRFAPAGKPNVYLARIKWSRPNRLMEK